MHQVLFLFFFVIFCSPSFKYNSEWIIETQNFGQAHFKKTILSSQYPTGLKTIYKPPFVIFYEGNIDLLKYSQKIIAVMGSHSPNVYIKKVANDMVQQLVNYQKILITAFNAGVEILVHQLIKENSISGNSVVIINDSNNYDESQQELLLYLKRYHLVIRLLAKLIW